MPQHDSSEQWHPPADEISLADLVRTLARRWTWVAGCVVLAAAAAAVFLLSRTPQYEYTATIRVGTLPIVMQDPDTDTPAALPIDSLANVLAQFERQYLPRAVQATGRTVAVSAQRVAGSDLVELTAEAPAAAADRVVPVMEHALGQVVADHRQALAGHLNQLRELGGAGTRAAGANTIASFEQALELLSAPLDPDLVAGHARAERILQGIDPLLRPTRIIALPTRSQHPINLSGGVVLTLAVVLGLLVGVLLGLAVESVARGRDDRQP